MAEVHQVPEFGSMSGSTGKRKKYKKLVLGAAVRAKLASAMLAPLLARVSRVPSVYDARRIMPGEGAQSLKRRV